MTLWLLRMMMGRGKKIRETQKRRSGKELEMEEKEDVGRIERNKLCWSLTALRPIFFRQVSLQKKTNDKIPQIPQNWDDEKSSMEKHLSLAKLWGR